MQVIKKERDITFKNTKLPVINEDLEDITNKIMLCANVSRERSLRIKVFNEIT